MNIKLVKYAANPQTHAEHEYNLGLSTFYIS